MYGTVAKQQVFPARGDEPVMTLTAGPDERAWVTVVLNWDMAVLEVGRGIMAAAEASRTTRATVDEFIEWLDSEDFGDDASRIRREAWGQDQ